MGKKRNAEGPESEITGYKYCQHILKNLLFP